MEGTVRGCRILSTESRGKREKHIAEGSVFGVQRADRAKRRESVNHVVKQIYEEGEYSVYSRNLKFKNWKENRKMRYTPYNFTVFRNTQYTQAKLILSC